VVPNAPFPLTSATDVTRSIELVLAAGATHVKLGGLPEARLRDALAECTARRIRCSGHVPTELRADTAARLGTTSFEHLFGFPENVSTISFETLNAWRREGRAPTLLERIAYRLRVRRRPPSVADTARATHDSVKALAVFRAIGAAGTSVTPTL